MERQLRQEWDKQEWDKWEWDDQDDWHKNQNIANLHFIGKITLIQLCRAYRKREKVNLKERYKCEKLFLQCLNKKNTFQIIIKIQAARFTQLKSLQINHLRLTNIESLTLIDFNSLIKLKIQGNSIIRISCFHKLMIPTLQQLHLHGNLITEITSLTKIKSNQNKRNVLKLDSSDPIGQDLSFISKMPLKLMKVVAISYSRITQKKTTHLFKSIQFI